MQTPHYTNVIWTKGASTRFTIGDFDEVPTSHGEATVHFTLYANHIGSATQAGASSSAAISIFIVVVPLLGSV